MARVLVVDDTPANRELLAFILRSLGHEVLTAEEGGSAIRIAEETKPDLVIVDILMPGVDGYETARLIRAHPDLAGVPLIAASVSPAVSEAKSRAAGFDRFLRFPVEVADFIAIVDEFLDRPLLELDRV